MSFTKQQLKEIINPSNNLFEDEIRMINRYLYSMKDKKEHKLCPYSGQIYSLFLETLNFKETKNLIKKYGFNFYFNNSNAFRCIIFKKKNFE